ncbi:hypothetical protein B7486_69400, partial [cyanobacterium TDX16]
MGTSAQATALDAPPAPTFVAPPLPPLAEVLAPEPEAAIEGRSPEATRTSDDGRSGRRLLLLFLLALVVGFGVRVACTLTDDVPTTDATAYLRSGASLWAGDGFTRDGEPELHFPPGT